MPFMDFFCGSANDSVGCLDSALGSSLCLVFLPSVFCCYFVRFVSSRGRDPPDDLCVSVFFFSLDGGTLGMSGAVVETSVCVRACTRGAFRNGVQIPRRRRNRTQWILCFHTEERQKRSPNGAFWLEQRQQSKMAANDGRRRRQKKNDVLRSLTVFRLWNAANNVSVFDGVFVWIVFEFDFDDCGEIIPRIPQILKKKCQKKS